MNEYEKAAEYMKEYVSENGYVFPLGKDDIEAALDDFNERFSPEILEKLSDNEVLSTIFSNNEGKDTLCYYLEFNPQCRDYFGSISGGSAYKFGLFRKKETGEWITGSSLKPVIVSEAEALKIAKNIRDILVGGSQIIRRASLQTLEDYEVLDAQLRSLLGDYYNLGWIHKYFSMVCPEKLSCFHSTDLQKHVLYALNIKPSEHYYARSGQIAMIENYAGWYYREFSHIFFEKFGGIKKFVRIGTTTMDGYRFANDWSKKSIIAIGWGDIGSLENYIVDNKLDRNSIAQSLEETYYPSEKGTASRKASEIIRFYEADKNTIFVAMDGQRLVAFLDEIGDYFFDDSAFYNDDESMMPHSKPCKWHFSFSDNEKLPIKDEGKLTTCYILNKEENLQYLYQKYYYGKEITVKEKEKKVVEYSTKISCNHERNRIIFGAPGTGKSYRLKTECESFLAGTSGEFERVTFHPDYSYAQFVGTYKPVMAENGEGIRYEYVPGPFMRVLTKALKNAMSDTAQPYILIIEEINRAKAAAVFGDIFQLLDRDENGVSEYEIQTSEDIRKHLSRELGIDINACSSLRLPNNMFIWATMNSADQGVYPMDTAFKRRWDFEYIDIDDNEKEIAGRGKFMVNGEAEPIEWNLLRKAINAKMVAEDFRINEDKLLGPFFLSPELIKSDENGMIVDEDRFIKAFKSKVLMYLYEDAVKQKRRSFFKSEYCTGYSALCKGFDDKGLEIFGVDFKKDYYSNKKDNVQ